MQWLCARGGRLYLLGRAPDGKLLHFRVDRILSIATPDNEVLDTKRFLTERLEIPPELYVARTKAV